MKIRHIVYTAIFALVCLSFLKLNILKGKKYVLLSSVTQHVSKSQFIVTDDGNGTDSQLDMAQEDKVSDTPHTTWHKDSQLTVEHGDRATGPPFVLEEDYAIFYNSYFNPDDIDHSFSVVNEQMASWRESIYANATLYYTNLGVAAQPFPCPDDGNCELLLQAETGWEELTLDKLQKYCQKYWNHNVVYMHSKGSFHASESNNNLRKQLTQSILSKECHDGLKNTNCNICSMRFSPLPHWHTPGNMWVARCSYIRKLLAPLGYATTVAKVVTDYGALGYWSSSPIDWSVGSGRYAAEHWVYTHPEVNPCDVYPDLNFMFGYGFQIGLPLEFSMAPRNFSHDVVSHYSAYTGNLRNPEMRFSYRLFELGQMYNVSAVGSFMSSWYRDADML
jgi:hypothetical protein